ncbi:hypothetical protein ACE6H2_028295 [Prunus campanulata]
MIPFPLILVAFAFHAPYSVGMIALVFVACVRRNDSNGFESFGMWVMDDVAVAVAVVKLVWRKHLDFELSPIMDLRRLDWALALYGSRRWMYNLL